MKNKISLLRFLPILFLTVMATLLSGCIEDGYTSSPDARPVFSKDTVDMGMVITTDVSTTQRFTVRNPNSKGIIISDIHVAGENADCFRLNVDGFSGTTFSDVEIRANDSIYVFVSCTLPENDMDAPTRVTSDICFTTNGVTERVVVMATGQDVNRLFGVTIDNDTSFNSGRPYQVFDSLVVAPDVTLTLEAGTSIMFHDRAYMRVYGTLITEGTVEHPVEFRGDRTGDVISGITFDLMAGQWQGVDFMPGSMGNKLSHTVIRNTVQGIIAEDCDIEIVNSRLRNSQYVALSAVGCDITAVGCEFAEAPYGTVYIQGGKAIFDHCTFPNYYLFSAIYGSAVTLAHLNEESAVEDFDAPYATVRITNSILYGLGNDIYPGDLTGTDVIVQRCLLKSAGSDDDNFIECLWESDPLYRTIREDYIFDYRLQPESPAIGAGDSSLSTHPAARLDAYGNPRGETPDLGAYVFTDTGDTD